jgi:hypothetical protein
MPIKLAPLSMSHPIASRSYLLIFPATCCTTPILRSMAERPSRDPTVANLTADEDTGSDSGIESIAMMTSSPTHDVALMAKGEIPELLDFLKKTSITYNERKAYHEHGWLTGNIISSILEVDVPTIKGSTIVYFEPHLVAGLGLLPSKFLVTILGYLNCELFHCVIIQSHLWQNRALSVSPPPQRIYFSFLQELLEGIPREVGPGRHAQTSTMGK